MQNSIRKIISGGQTGADRCGLEIASKFGIPTGGYVPIGFLTENGPDETLKQYHVIEHDIGYKHRTKMNVMSSDMTLLFVSDRESFGSKMTINYCRIHNKPFVIINIPDDSRSLDEWSYHLDLQKCVKLIDSFGSPVTINIAGNRLSVSQNIKYYQTWFLMKLFIHYNTKNNAI